jgi:hypothetical protein
MSSIPASPSTPSPATATTPGGRPALCPRCGAAFECGAARPPATPCGCAGIGLTPAQRALLAERYDGCLCLACLGAIARGDAGDAGDAQEAAR